MKSVVAKRSVVINGHKTRISLEGDFWTALQDIATESHQDVGQLLASVAGRPHNNLSSAIRLFILDYYRDEFEARTSAEALDGFITSNNFGKWGTFWRGFE